MDEIDEIPEFDEEIAPLTTRQISEPETKTSQPKKAVPPAITPKKNVDVTDNGGVVDLVVVGELTNDVIQQWISVIPASTFHRIFLIGKGTEQQKQQLQTLASTGTLSSNDSSSSSSSNSSSNGSSSSSSSSSSNGSSSSSSSTSAEEGWWALGVLRHLKEVNGGKLRPNMRQVVDTVFVSANDTTNLLSKLAAHREQQQSYAMHWVLTDLVDPTTATTATPATTATSATSADSSSKLSFSEYYEAICWRPVPPSGRVCALSGRCMHVKTDRVMQLPTSFFARAIALHANMKHNADRFFDHVAPSIFADFAPPIHE